MKKEHWIAISLIILALSLGVTVIASAAPAVSSCAAAPLCAE